MPTEPLLDYSSSVASCTILLEECICMPAEIGTQGREQALSEHFNVTNRIHCPREGVAVAKASTTEARPYLYGRTLLLRRDDVLWVVCSADSP